MPNGKIITVPYFGGKFYYIDFVLKNLPYGTFYVEPFGGAAWVLLNKPRHPSELYNDINGSIVTMYRVLQDKEKYEVFRHKIEYTLYSFEEYRKAVDIYNGRVEADDVDRAWAVFVMLSMAFSGIQQNRPGSFRFAVKTNVPIAFSHRKESLQRIHERLQYVIIDNRDALDVIRRYDTPDTVFYLDPPYPTGTRKEKIVYTHEMSDEKHEELVDLLLQVKGSFALSSYDNPIYNRLVEAGLCYKVVKDGVAHSAKKADKEKMESPEWEEFLHREEVLYIKPGKYGQRRLFDE
jgi:DNA adenine methylase